MNKNLDQEVNKLDNRIKWILILGAVVLVLMPILVTQFHWLFDFTETGQIGDTIGGTTAPIIGMLSALLIYFSFRAQINANRIIQNQIDDQKIGESAKKNFEYQMERYRHLKEYIYGFKYSISNVGFYGSEIRHNMNEYYGSQAINLFFQNKKPSPSEESEIKTIISFFTLIMNNIIGIKDNSDSKFIFNLLEIQFYRNIWDPNESLITSVLENPNNIKIEFVEICQRFRDIHIELTKYKAIWPD